MTDAASYWAGRRVGAFTQPRPWSAPLADVVADYEPEQVLEFGCNVGRHMHVMQERMPSAQFTGVDISLPAVQKARHSGLTVLLGDEWTLYIWPADRFDVAYTVSVLDHLLLPMTALAALDSIARVLVLVEPWLGYEGEVEHLPGGGRANPYLYSWDYGKLLPHRSWRVLPFPLHQKGAGPYYRMHIGER